MKNYILLGLGLCAASVHGMEPTDATEIDNLREFVAGNDYSTRVPTAPSTAELRSRMLVVAGSSLPVETKVVLHRWGVMAAASVESQTAQHLIAKTPVSKMVSGTAGRRLF